MCRGQSGLDQIICESMLHVVGQAQYVQRVLQSVIRVDPVWLACLEVWTGILNTLVFKTAAGNCSQPNAGAVLG